MNIKHALKPQKPSDNHLFAILLPSTGIADAQKFVNKYLSRTIKVGRAFADRGEKKYFTQTGKRVVFLGLGDGRNISLEEIRKVVYGAVATANEGKCRRLTLLLPGNHSADQIMAATETIILSNYQFLTYKTSPKTNSLTDAFVICESDGAADAVQNAAKVAEAVCITRDLVNEPVVTLTAVELGERTIKLGKQFGFTVEVLNMAKIKALKMGGLLAVNAGSPDPPTFSILEYKPKNAKNKKPIVLVGKGVVYDTGGLSLKETAGSMDSMKCDMAGGGAVIGTFCAIASMKLPVHVVGLIPTTDNRPGGNAITPGDVITMHNGTTVEILNTDAEGRLILADALSYAKKYDPELVIDLATLTGAAIIIIGNSGIVMTSTASEDVNEAILESGDRVYERMVQLPLWDEFKDQLKSDIADLKNIGGKPAGSLTAAKFLEQFTSFPWIHLDIAGPAFLNSSDNYRGKNGTGVGVRLLTDFISLNYAQDSIIS